MANSHILLAKALESLPLGSIRPDGWLLDQLRIQADGLTGHLDEFWPDIADSGWIGGKEEGWERGPYWLDGLVPLAFLLDDARLKGKVQRWMNYILDHQHEDGWLGPLQDSTYGYLYDPWPVFVVLKAMTQYQEATGDTRVIPAIERFLRRLQTLLEQKPLTSWAMLRSSELVLSIYWVYEHTREDWLLSLVRRVEEQSFDWRFHYENFQYKERQEQWKFESHVVNSSMSIKQPGLRYRLWHDEADREAVTSIIATLDTYHGQATGVFTGDEVLAGKNPSQGTELCAVVEYLFSLEVLLSLFGDVAFADRLERIAFNALPATFKPDMWAHQYDQQANQVICAVSEDRVFATNGPEANIFGLAPNFGCCTANMHQGWPKFTTHLWMRTPDHGFAALAYAPCIVTSSAFALDLFGGGRYTFPREAAGTMSFPGPVEGTEMIRIEVRTNYPFEEDVRITVIAEQAVRFPLSLRIPGWAHSATVTVGEDTSKRVQPGSFYTIEREWSGHTSIGLHFPMSIKTQTRYHGSVSLERGPLVYSLKIDEEWRQIRGELPHADWEVYPRSAWNYALELDREHPEASCRLESRPVGERPFSPEGAPIFMKVKGRRIPEWTIEHNAAGPIPQSPVTSTEPVEELTLIPYGCTNLRVTEFPTLQMFSSQESTDYQSKGKPT